MAAAVRRGFAATAVVAAVLQVVTRSGAGVDPLALVEKISCSSPRSPPEADSTSRLCWKGLDRAPLADLWAPRTGQCGPLTLLLAPRAWPAENHVSPVHLIPSDGVAEPRAWLQGAGLGLGLALVAATPALTSPGSRLEWVAAEMPGRSCNLCFC
jgi:hypothetical protein